MNPGWVLGCVWLAPLPLVTCHIGLVFSWLRYGFIPITRDDTDSECEPLFPASAGRKSQRRPSSSGLYTIVTLGRDK